LITRIMLREGYRTWSSSLCSLHHSLLSLLYIIISLWVGRVAHSV
jgi:hypothetical protein